MSKEKQIAELLMIANVIFQSKQDGTDIERCSIATNAGVFKGRWFVDGKLRGFDFQVLSGEKIILLRVIEQNPEKRDGYMNLKQNAILAQRGHRIAWVIRRDTNKFIGKIMDGEFTEIKPKATTTATFNNSTYNQQQVIGEDQYNQNYQAYDDGSFVSDLPEILQEDIVGIVGG